MIVKFHPRGRGGGAGPVDYLLGKDRQRDGATVLQGKPEEVRELIDASPYAKKYTSGVLSFAEQDLAPGQREKLMAGFERVLMPGLDKDQYSVLWVEHRDKGRLELNFFIRSDAVNPADVTEAAVYFNASVSNQTVTWLLSSLAELHGNYRNIKDVDVYINSEGGDMDAGYVAYEALRKSPLKLNMIDASMIASSSSLIYCASDDRYAMPLATFVLHPAAAWNEKADYLKPDQAQRVLEDAENYNVLFRRVYAACTNIPPDELNRITTSETARAVYKVDAAVKAGLVTRGIKETHGYPLTYYITDGQN